MSMEKLRAEKFEREMGQMKNPEINATSSKMVDNKDTTLGDRTEEQQVRRNGEDPALPNTLYYLYITLKTLG